VDWYGLPVRSAVVLCAHACLAINAITAPICSLHKFPRAIDKKIIERGGDLDSPPFSYGQGFSIPL